MQVTHVLRAARFDDLPRILEVQIAALASYYAGFAQTIDRSLQLQLWTAGLNARERRIRVLLIDGEIVGVSDVEYLGPPLELFARIVGLYVHPSVHELGLGLAMFTDQLLWLSQRTATEIRCHVDPVNVRAQRFFMRRGFCQMCDRLNPRWSSFFRARARFCDTSSCCANVRLFFFDFFDLEVDSASLYSYLQGGDVDGTLLRPARPQDIEQIVRVEVAALGRPTSGPAWEVVLPMLTPLWSQTFLRVLTGATCICVIEVQGRVVAVAKGHIFGRDSSLLGGIEGIYVDPDFQRRGYAERLFQFLQSWVRDWCAGAVIADVAPHNLPARLMVAGWGFVPARPGQVPQLEPPNDGFDRYILVFDEH